MAKDYLKDKSNKKKSASVAGWAIAGIVLVFAILLGRFAIQNNLIFSGLPGSDDAYAVAKGFISPTVLSKNIKYADDQYKFAKKTDSVYVIKSSYSAEDDNGDRSTTNFTITLKYNGGAAQKEQNWTMLDLNKDE